MSPPSSATDASSHPDDWMNMLDHIMEGHHSQEDGGGIEHLVYTPNSASVPCVGGSVSPFVLSRCLRPGSLLSGASSPMGDHGAFSLDASSASVAHVAPPPDPAAAVGVPVACAVRMSFPFASEPPAAAAAAAAAPDSVADSAAGSVPVASHPSAPTNGAVSGAYAEGQSANTDATAGDRVALASASASDGPAPAPPALIPAPGLGVAAASSSPEATAGKPNVCNADDISPDSFGADSDYAASGYSDGGGITSGTRAQARSERKRTREKQRRSDVNAQFASLTSLLRKIEQEDLNADAAEAEATGAELEERKSTLGFLNSIGRTGCPTNRADLIAMTICVLERLHAQNGRMRRDRRNLRLELEQSKRINEDLARKHKQVEAAAQQAALGAAHAAAMPKQDKVMMMVPMMVTPDQVAGIHNITHGMQVPYPMMQHMPPAAFMPQMSHPQQQPLPSASVAAASTSSTSLSHAVPSQPPNAAPPHAAHAPPAPTSHHHPMSMPTPGGGFPMGLMHPGGFFFKNSKLPAHPTPHGAPLMPNSMIHPSFVPPLHPLQQSFTAAASGASTSSTSPAAAPVAGGHSPGNTQAAMMTAMTQPPPPQSLRPMSTALSIPPSAAAVDDPTRRQTQGGQQHHQQQQQQPSASPSLQGGGANHQFPPPHGDGGSAPGGSPGGSGAGNGAGGGGGNLAHCA